jgi:DNA processing protein
LIRCPGLGARTLIDLVEGHGGAQRALSAGRNAWKRAGASDVACKALEQVDEARLDADLQWLGQPRRGLIVWTDPNYPKPLRNIAHPPAALFWRGDASLLDDPQLAIVGSRNATPQGLENARAFAAEFARRGLAITSGLALGVDGEAHRGALSGGGVTIAVCATGLDRVYPARHKELAEDIENRGLLMSEFAPGTPPRAEHFPQRNRLICGLALGVLVVEAARESGSLITARLAAEQGREVFAIPGSIHNPMSRGCHQLIRQGAKLVETADDVLEELAAPLGAWLRARPAQPPSAAAGAVPENGHDAVLAALGDDVLTLDALVERTKLPVDQLNARLLQLEMEGRIGSVPGGRFMRLGAK